MKDYRKSFFWRCLWCLGVAPHDVNCWKSSLARGFHCVTFWVFFNEKRCSQELAEAVNGIRNSLAEWEEAEHSL